ncbi:MAG: patatin-like phospholipase family protein [Myxococcales bacterium]|nr:patatin-like phospholipase family protein [Myxococcales bacterium]
MTRAPQTPPSSAAGDAPRESLAAWLARAPFGLAMSSGFFGFFAHAGMLTALEHSGLVPSRIAGSSAGALVGGLWASGLASDDLRRLLVALRREDFWDPAPGLGVLRGARFAAKLRDALATQEFATCRVPSAFSLFDLGKRTTIIADRGDLTAAIAGSCAFPGLFQPVRWQDRWVLDGGIADRPGLASVPSGARTLFHHLSSRSPWRSAASAALQVPHRANMVSLVIDDLPRLNPFRLERGPEAFQRAYDATCRALSQPVADDLVRLSAT